MTQASAMVTISAEDIGLLSEALRLAAIALRGEVRRLHYVAPNSPMIARYAAMAEDMEACRTRIEAQ